MVVIELVFLKKNQKLENYGWNTASNSQSNFDELEDKFRRWETQDELEQLKRKMGK